MLAASANFLADYVLWADKFANGCQNEYHKHASGPVAEWQTQWT